MNMEISFHWWYERLICSWLECSALSTMDGQASSKPRNLVKWYPGSRFQTLEPTGPGLCCLPSPKSGGPAVSMSCPWPFQARAERWTSLESRTGCRTVFVTICTFGRICCHLIHPLGVRWWVKARPPQLSTSNFQRQKWSDICWMAKVTQVT